MSEPSSGSAIEIRTPGPSSGVFGDFVQPFQIEAPGLRGRLVRLDATLDRALGRHDYPEPVARLLAEAMAMAAVLASGLKYDGIFTLQLNGDGPVGMVMSDVTSTGSIRAYARVDADRLAAIVPDVAGTAKANGNGGRAPRPRNGHSVDRTIGTPVPRLIGAGHLAFTVDQGPNTDRYQGITEIEGATLAECAHAYFRRSEQVDTAITICASGPKPGEGGRRAAALVLQRLPPGGSDDEKAEADDAWRRAVVLMSSVQSTELLTDELSAFDILYRLFHEDGVRVYPQRPLRYQCRCSRERVERTLRSFERDKIQSLADDDGYVRVTCEFCKAEYAFDQAALDAVYTEDGAQDDGDGPSGGTPGG